MISMVPSPGVPAFLEAVRRDYYEARSMGDLVTEALFATQPGDGATVYF